MVKKLWISDQVWEELCANARAKYPLETGGMLLGYQANNADYVVSSIIGPGLRAKHKRHSFTPDADYQQTELEKIYWQSQRKYTYLGDWHTHPDGCCNHSNKDNRTLSRIARESTDCNVLPIMLVLANHKGGWKGKARRFLSSQKRGWFNECNVEEIPIVKFSSKPS